MRDSDCSPSPGWSRRSFLSTGIIGLTASALAACRGDTAEQRGDMEVPATSDDDAWTPIRDEFITDPGVVYLNNASVGMPPAVVADTVSRGYRLHARDPIRAKHELSEIIETRVWPNLARFLGASRSEIFLTGNATEALHLAAAGLSLEPGDQVLITTQEHPAGRRPWRYLAATRGLEVKDVFIPSPFDEPQQVIDLISAHLTSRTRAIAFCHVTRGGHLYPVKQLAEMARERQIATVVDGAQAVGMLPVDLHELGCDAYAASLHKWLLGPIGTGVLYVRGEFQNRMRSVYDEFSSPEQPNYTPGGTAALPVRAGIDAALSFVDTIGIRRIERRNRFLSDYLKARLAEMPSVTLLSGPTADTSAPGSTIFEVDGVEAFGAVPALAEREGVHIDEHVRDGHNAIRVSTHFYNTTQEIDRLVAALGPLAA